MWSSELYGDLLVLLLVVMLVVLVVLEVVNRLSHASQQSERYQCHITQQPPTCTELRYPWG